MPWLHEFLSRVKGSYRRGESQTELAEEIRLHMEMLEEDNVRGGMDREQARRSARITLGEPARIQEEYRRRAGIAVVEVMLQDIRYGFRMLRKSLAFTALAVLTLALGIGANSAIFSMVYGVLLKPLPYDDPERLMAVFGAIPAKNAWYTTVSAPDFRALRNDNRTFDSFSGFYSRSFNVNEDQHPERIRATMVSWEYFRTFGIEPVLGRTFLPSEEQWGNHRSVVLSENYWQIRFNADPKIVGKTLRMDGEPYTVVGVMCDAFDGSHSAQIWAPMSWAPNDDMDTRDNAPLNIVGRLKFGVTREQAYADLNSIMVALAKEFPEDTGFGANLRPLLEAWVGRVRPALFFLMGSVALVLLIACSNIANLLLARAAGRKREIAIRFALGASRGRIAGQLIIESMLLSSIGGLLGVAVAYLLLRLMPLAGASIPRMHQVHLDGHVLLFTMAISLFTGILFGLAPALGMSDVNPEAELKEGGRGMSSGKRTRLRSALVVGELCLALALLTGAGLSVKSFIRLFQTDPGFDTQNLLTFTVDLPSSYDPSRYRLMLNGASALEAAFYEQLLSRLEALPGVEAAGAVSTLPFRGNQWAKYFTPLDRPLPTSIDRVPIVQYRPVAGHYFQTAKIRLLEGRLFDEHDRHDSPPVIVISQAFAKRFWPDQDPVGKTIILDPPQNLVPANWLPPGYHLPTGTIVGVVGDVHYAGLEADSVPLMYAPFEQQDTFLNMAVIVRTKMTPTTIVPLIRSIVKQLDGAQPIANIETMDDLVSHSVAGPRLITVLLGSFGVLGVLLATIGIYGLMTYFVTQRTNEIGIRMALGASRGNILGMMIKDGLQLAGIGLILGTVLSVVVTRIMSGFLFGVRGIDPVIYAVTFISLGMVVLLACLIPSMRATRLDPAIALRCE